MIKLSYLIFFYSFYISIKKYPKLVIEIVFIEKINLKIINQLFYNLCLKYYIL